MRAQWESSAAHDGAASPCLSTTLHGETDLVSRCQKQSGFKLTLPGQHLLTATKQPVFGGSAAGSCRRRL